MQMLNRYNGMLLIGELNMENEDATELISLARHPLHEPYNYHQHHSDSVVFGFFLGAVAPCALTLEADVPEPLPCIIVPNGN